MFREFPKRRNKGSTVSAATEQCFDVVVVAQEGHEQFRASVLEDKPQVAVAAAFEKLTPQLTDAQTAVYMRLTVDFEKITEGQKAFYPLVFRELAQTADDCGVDRKYSSQAAL